MDPLSIILGFFIGLCLGAGSLAALWMRTRIENARLAAQIESEKSALEQASLALDQRFRLTANEALQNSAQQFLNLAQERLKAQNAESAHDLEKRQLSIQALIDPIHKNLVAMGQALEQAKGTDLALRADLQLLSRETARLVGALRDPSAQGVWGEFILQGVLDKSGLIKGVHYDTQVSMESDSGRLRPDAVIHLHDGFHIVVDAKAPITDSVQQISRAPDENAQNVTIQNLARQVREHVRKLGQKGYWENLDGIDFTVLFLPSEHVFSMALRADPDLVDYAAQRNVIIASPTLLISLLRVVALSWRQVDIAKNAQTISALGLDVYKSLSVFVGHIGKIGKNLDTAMGAYNDAVGSLERNVLLKARKFEELGLAPASTTLDAPVSLDRPIRLVRE
jgi:DNA recombination protein RmuC